MRTWRKFRKIDAVFLAQEELHTPDTGTGQSLGHSSGHPLRLAQMFGRNRGRLETFAVIAALLHMADGRTKERRAMLLRDGQQGDFAVEADELLDDQLADVAARPLATVSPRMFQFVGPLHERLPLARRRHQRLDDAREPDFRSSLAQLLVSLGIEIFRRP